MENKLQASSTISFSTQAEADSNTSALSYDTAGDNIALVASPLKEKLDLTSYFSTGRILCLCVGGDPEPDGSILDFSWVLDLRNQCIKYDIPFYFTSTGANFLFKGHTYHIEKRFQASQARKADVHYFPVKRAFNPPVCNSESSQESKNKDSFSDNSFEIPHLNFHIEETDGSSDSDFTDRPSSHETLAIPGINYEVEVDSSDCINSHSSEPDSVSLDDSYETESLSSVSEAQIETYCNKLFDRLSKSKFRSGFHLHNQEKDYYRSQGDSTIRKHALDFIAARLAPDEPVNDGKQTPMRGHPVFIAQHATACCCRGCLKKWHHIPEHRPLTEAEQHKIVDIIMAWIHRDLDLQ